MTMLKELIMIIWIPLNFFVWDYLTEKKFKRLDRTFSEKSTKTISMKPFSKVSKKRLGKDGN